MADPPETEPDPRLDLDEVPNRPQCRFPDRGQEPSHAQLIADRRFALAAIAATSRVARGNDPELDAGMIALEFSHGIAKVRRRGYVK